MSAIHHVGLTVSDLERSTDFYADLLGGDRLGPFERSVRALSEPIVASAPLAGHRCVYVLDPDRIRVELVEPPHESAADPSANE
ncbi:VOC family protein [Cryptosporangium arvum]|uniref:Lactoylglutathione lyase-like lyase n=1 Tax=Cryptosporangium arvum DSM 44712 TaxID=927661 RepID=A0A010YQD5_9ACTN|nr:VOC family protein [Cryptosporangium arvum]EXG82405.1 lactoylglutathione lyase-like lyase [Cryptosporangium arvum DSM 44712]